MILPTAISGAWEHNKHNSIQKKVALILGLCGLLGALAGATLANYLPGSLLENGFGGLLLAAALWMGLGQRVMSKTAQGPTTELGLAPRDTLWLSAVCGFPIGIVVGLTGIGGGVLIVPVLVLIFHFPIHMAVGTSLASIVFTSLGGIIGYILNGIGMSPLPYSMGYINLLMWLCLAATSVPLAHLGSKAAHALPAKQLKYIFIAVMAYIGLRMIGIV